MDSLESWKHRLFCLVASICHIALAGEKDLPLRKHLLHSPPVALALQTNHLQLTPKGAIRVQTALERRPDWQAPITRARGNLHRLGVLRFDFGIADNVTIQIRGALEQILQLNQQSIASEGAKTTHDAGDFSVATLAQLVPIGKLRPALGFRIETKLPNTNQDRGLGTNTTDVTMSILATQRFEPVLIFAEAGIGILTSPRQLNDQNDVFVYGLGWLWRLSQSFQLAGEINGFTSPRQQIPVGTEDRSAARLGLMWRLPKLALELLAVKGVTEREGNWGMVAGASWQLNLLRGTQKTY